MKKPKVRVMTYIPFGIFPGSLMFSCGFSYAEMNEQFDLEKADGWKEAISLDKELVESSTWLAMRRTVEKSGKEVDYFFVYVKKPFDFKYISYCKLAHEILHICQFYLPTVLNRNKEHEAEAYFHTYLMESCLKAIRG